VLYVHPKYQRQGIGSALMMHVINLAEEEGCNCCSVCAEDLALDFYRRFGFERYFNRKSFKAKTRASSGLTPAISSILLAVSADVGTNGT